MLKNALQKYDVPLLAQSSTKNPNNTKTLQAQILIILPQNFPPACEAELSYAFHKDLRLIIRKIMRDHLVNIRPACSADNVYKEVAHHVFTP